MSGIGRIEEGSEESESLVSSDPSSSFGSDDDSISSEEVPESDEDPSSEEGEDANNSLMESDTDDAPDDSDAPESSGPDEPSPEREPKKVRSKVLADRLKKANNREPGRPSNNSGAAHEDVSSKLENELNSLSLGLGSLTDPNPMVVAANDDSQASAPPTVEDEVVASEPVKSPPPSEAVKPALKPAVPKQGGDKKKESRKLSFRDDSGGTLPPRTGSKPVVPSSSTMSTTLGYKLVKACYENDPLETVGVKIMAESYTLSVYITLMDEGDPVFATYELGESSMATDPSNPKRLYFRTLDALITFEAQFPVDIQTIVNNLPEGVITYDTKYVTGDSLNQAPSGRPQINLLGTSRDREFAPPGGEVDEDEGIKGYSRLELLESHIRKPQLSVRRVRQICHWINSLKLWKQTVDIGSLHGCICNGVLLARIVQKVIPGTKFLHLNEKALSRRAALENLEKSLGQIWRSKCVNNSRIPSATDIYDGNMHKIATMLQEIFEVYVQRPLLKQAIKVLKWYNNILKQYSRRLPIGIFTESDFQAVWSHFQSGTALFCVIYHLFGPVTVGSGRNLIKIDPIRVVEHPANLSEFRTNLMYVFSLLHALEVDVIWDVMDWLSYPDVDFVLLQLTIIFDKLKQRQCSLPPAQGMNAGVTSGPQGLMVVGMVFSDTVITSNDDSGGGDHATALKRNRSVLLGAGSESLKMLPIDDSNSGQATRFQSSALPAGLIASETTVDRVQINIKSKRAASQRNAWMSTVDMSDDPINVFNSTQVAVLKRVNQTAGNAEAAKPTANKTLPAADARGIDAAIESLEYNTTQNRNALDAMEDALAERYGQLETRVQLGLMSADAYEDAFLGLEKERIALEDDRAKSEEIYQLRLDSIRAQREEAKLRHDAEIEYQKKSIVARKVVSPSKSRALAKKVSPKKSKKKGGEANVAAITSEAKEKLEQSWISYHGRVKDSLNTKIKKLADRAQEQLQVNWKESKLSKTGSNFKESTMPSTNHEQVWLTFKRTLANRTRAFYDDKEEKTMRLDNILSPIRKAAASSKVPVAVSVATQRTSFLSGGGDSSEYPRMQEIAMMQEEENYRRRYLRAVMSDKSAKELEDLDMVDHAQDPLSNVIRLKKDAQAVDSLGMPLDQIALMREIEGSLRMLQQQRVLGMWDRNVRRNYTWYVERALVATSLGMGSPGREAGEDAEYRLMWVDNGGDRSQGFVSIEDIETIEAKPHGTETLLMLELGESPHMLMASGGRTELHIGFPAVADCDVFVQNLKRLYECTMSYKKITRMR